jgi:hypothetical protein
VGWWPAGTDAPQELSQDLSFLNLGPVWASLWQCRLPFSVRAPPRHIAEALHANAISGTSLVQLHVYIAFALGSLVHFLDIRII